MRDTTGQSRTNSSSVVLAALAACVLAVPSSCSPADDVHRLSDAEPGHSEPALFVMLSNLPSKTDADAYRLIAHAPGRDLDRESVEFCFDRTDLCRDFASPGVTRVAGRAFVATDGRGTTKYTLFVSEKYVRLSHDLPLTMLAKDASGAAIVEPMKIAGKGSAPGTTTAAGACLETDTFTCQVELEIVRLTNEHRRGEGVTPDLVYDAKLAYVARLWSKAQAERGYIGHDWMQSGMWLKVYEDKFGERAPVEAENVAQGRSGRDAAAIATELVDMWWSSPAHRVNMVGRHTLIGAGWASSSQGGSYGTQSFGTR